MSTTNSGGSSSGKKRKNADNAAAADDTEISSVASSVTPVTGVSTTNGTTNKAETNGSTTKKKQKTTTSVEKGTTAVETGDTEKKKKDDEPPFVAMTLNEIRTAIKELTPKVPDVPEGGIDETDALAIRSWATKMQAVIEECNLLLCCVANATYRWVSERSGAGDQNLSVLSNELGNAQEQISSSVTPRLTNVLAPVVDLVEAKVTKTKNDETGEEVKTKTFEREVVDPSFLKLCQTILSRNARMLRQVVLTNFSKIDRVIVDYQKATKKDSHSDRSFAY